MSKQALKIHIVVREYSKSDDPMDETGEMALLAWEDSLS